MIRIHKPTSPPRVLTTLGRRQKKADLAAFTADRAGYRSGAKLFTFDRTIYAHPSVKQALLTAQHEKCAFCEAKVLHVSSGDVEHFRPKAAVKDATGSPLIRPGYFWLAYDWDNLLFCCENCNRRHKGSLFPLSDPKKRVRSHRVKLTGELPLFINPASEDPAQYIEFVGETVIAKGGHPRGQATIDELGLERSELREHRLTKLKLLRQLRQVLAQLQLLSRPTRSQQKTIADIEALLLEHQQPTAEYSAMACTLLR